MHKLRNLAGGPWRTVLAAAFFAKFAEAAALAMARPQVAVAEMSWYAAVTIWRPGRWELAQVGAQLESSAALTTSSPQQSRQ